MDRLLVDTGFLVAYGKENDPLHGKADRFLSRFRGTLYTVAPVIVETCFFLNARAKQRLLEWVHQGGITVVDVPVADYADLCAVIRKYASRDVDMADASLVWLAEKSGLRRLLTVDRADFSILRLKAGKRFELVAWF